MDKPKTSTVSNNSLQQSERTKTRSITQEHNSAEKLSQNQSLIEEEVKSDSDDTKLIGMTEEQTYGIGSICCFDENHERSFFLMIMTLIFCSLCARVIFLMIIFVRQEW